MSMNDDIKTVLVSEEALKAKGNKKAPTTFVIEAKK